MTRYWRFVTTSNEIIANNNYINKDLAINTIIEHHNFVQTLMRKIF